MSNLKKSFPLGLIAALILIAVPSCGEPSDLQMNDAAATDATTPPDAAFFGDAASAADAAGQQDAAIPNDGAALADSGPPADAGATSTHITVTIPAGDNVCFEFATGTQSSTQGNCAGDLLIVQGGNVDISHTGLSGGICTQPGSYSAVSGIPTDYSGCVWLDYLEGTKLGGLPALGQTGYIVRDAASTHHYRMLIIDNAGDTLEFWYDQID